MTQPKWLLPTQQLVAAASSSAGAAGAVPNHGSGAGGAAAATAAMLLLLQQNLCCTIVCSCTAGSATAEHVAQSVWLHARVDNEGLAAVGVGAGVVLKSLLSIEYYPSSKPGPAVRGMPIGESASQLEVTFGAASSRQY